MSLPGNENLSGNAQSDVKFTDHRQGQRTAMVENFSDSSAATDLGLDIATTRATLFHRKADRLDRVWSLDGMVFGGRRRRVIEGGTSDRDGFYETF